jgi:hypothetical protein
MAETNKAPQNSTRQSSGKISPNNKTQTEKPPSQPQSEIERVYAAETYCKLDRDEELFSWFNDQRDMKLCGYVMENFGSGLLKTCQLYQIFHVRKRGSLLEIPATVAFINMFQKGTISELCQTILEEFGHPLSRYGRLRELRSRTWDTLSRYGVKILIVGNADYLKLEALNELVDLFQNLKIPVVLTGTHYVKDILERGNPSYSRVRNSFLEWHEFTKLSRADIVQVIADWESKFLSESNRLDLCENSDVIEIIYIRSNGLIDSVYDMLRKIVVYRLEDPDFELNLPNLTVQFSRREAPTLK